MPWSASDAIKKTKKANTRKKAAKWAKIANAALRSGKSEASAVRIANASM
jgi:uncharacterized protein YdaT